MNISIKETVEMNGYCPVQNGQVLIDITYKKISVLGDPHEYAIAVNNACPNIEECPDPSNCPVALQKIYW